MKKQFLTIALAATVVIGGLCTAEAVPCKVGETPKAPAPCQKVECETPKAPCRQVKQKPTPWLLYTSDAADDSSDVW